MSFTGNAIDQALDILRQTRTPITILGASGFVGSHLAAYLRGLELDVKTPQKGDNAIFSDDLGHVIYCIGLTADYASRPYDTVEAHTSLLSRLLKEGHYKSLVYLSSTRLYDFANGAGREEADIVLNPQNPRHVYDLSKALGEWLCLHAANGKARVARLASVYSRYLTDRNFLHTTLEQALAGQDFALDTAPDYARDYIYIDDVCAALLSIAVCGKQSIYNVASGQNVSNRDLFALIKQHLGVAIAASKPAQRAQSPEIDISRLKDDFGLRPARLADTIDDIIAFNRDSLKKAHGTS